jgi:hypothetical protein
MVISKGACGLSGGFIELSGWGNNPECKIWRVFILNPWPGRWKIPGGIFLDGRVLMEES